MSVQSLAVVFVVLLYYGLVVQRIGDYPARLLHRITINHLPAARSFSADELDSILRLSIAGVMQLFFCGTLVIVTGVNIENLMPRRFDLLLVGYGFLLGIGDAALGAYLAYLGMQTAMKIAPTKVPHAVDAWLTMSKGGWIRYYLKTAEAAPVWMALLLANLYISIEEIIFRGILINSFQVNGTMVALGVSTVLFMLIQVFNMPSWHSAMFPVLGALVIGLTHGSLYLVIPEILPLIIAHIVSFAVAVL